MIEEINKYYKKKYSIIFGIVIILSLLIFSVSLMVGQYGFINPLYLIKMTLNGWGGKYEVPDTYCNIIQYIRMPRTLAAFFVGGSLSISGAVYQTTFNNKLISPDILGVSAGACVGAGCAILLELSNTLIGVFAFVFGMLAVTISICLPKVFRNRSNIILVLSGIIVSAFMNSIIGLLKYLADRDDKLASITFWMMGSVTGTQMSEIVGVLALIIVPLIVLCSMGTRIDVISFGRESAQSMGIHFGRNRLVIIVCSTILTATSVSIGGNVGWVGLVIPHITRALVGNKSKEVIPIAFMVGGCFMMVVDMLSRTLSKDDVPLSIITGIFGAIIYSIVLIKKGQSINEQ